MEERLTFKKIMEYHPDNSRIFAKIKKQLNQIVPFVGAGLSAFCYPQWKKTLERIAVSVTNSANKKAVQADIKERRQTP